MKTELKDRVLWFDGTNQVDPELVPSLILSGVSLDKLKVTYANEDINLFNLISDENISSVKSSNTEFDKTWTVPDVYLNLNFKEYVYAAFESRHLSNRDAYLARIETELNQIESRQLETFFKTVIYILDTFKKQNIVWGVGRGSSCACLILFLIGLHSVDPVKYGIDITEFFHD